MSAITWPDVVTSIAAVVSAVVAIGALGAACFAYRQLKRQIAQADRQHKEQLGVQRTQHRQQVESSLLPKVLVAHFELERNGGDTFIAVWLANVGPGPALAVTVSAWLRVVEPSEVRRYRSDVDSAATEILSQPVEFSVRLAALAATSAKDAVLLTANADALQSVAPPSQGARSTLYYAVQYKDVFGTEFDTWRPRDRAEARAGHVIAQPPGTWRFLGLPPPPPVWPSA